MHGPYNRSDNRALNVFQTAVEARQSPVREHVIHTEIRLIESAILDASQNGFFNVTINDTPMTNNVSAMSEVWTVDTTNNNIIAPDHGLKMGEAVTLTTTGVLPSPLMINTLYYVIYVDPNTIKLADSFANAVSRTPISIQIVDGVNQLVLTDQGSGYLIAPNVTVLGGNATVPASITASLAYFGGVMSITPTSFGSYNDEPSMVITPQGSGAAAGNISFVASSMTVAVGGTNYRVGDILSVVGGTGTASTAIVTEIDSITGAGSVVSVSVSNPGLYTTLPTLTGATTSALPSGGSGCQLNLTMGIGFIAISSGGLNYTKPPVVIISGGGGSGVSAIAIVNAGTVSGVGILNPGQGFTSIPTVEFDTGDSAEAMAVLSPVGLANVFLTFNGGNTYTTTPNVTIEAPGSGVTIGTVFMMAISATLNNPGINYKVGDILLVSGGQGILNTTIQVLSTTVLGQITSFVMTNAGQYSIIPPVLTANQVLGGSGSAASFNLSFGVNSINVSNIGSGFITSPVAIISGGGGTGASAIAPIVNGQVPNIFVTSSGQNFVSVPNVFVFSGSGATAIANLTPTLIANVTIINGGNDYTQGNTTVSFDGSATGNVTVSNGTIQSIEVVVNADYTFVPNVTITGGDGTGVAVANLVPTSLSNVQLTAIGGNFTGNPTVTIDGNATAVTSLIDTGIGRVDIINTGNNYVAAPAISTVAGNLQVGNVTFASFNSSIGFAINNLNLIDPGVDYQSTPTIVISPPASISGVTATATANIGPGFGTFALQAFNVSRDYFSVYRHLTPSNPDLTRPYEERMNTVIAYFSGLGYTIRRSTNFASNNTFIWVINW
jgi:hypothetical protein